MSFEVSGYRFGFETYLRRWARLYAFGMLERQAEVIARIAIPHSANGNSESIPKFYYPKSMDSINLVFALGIGDLGLEAFCEDGNFNFMNIIAGGAPVMRKTGRTLAPKKAHRPTIYSVWRNIYFKYYRCILFTGFF